MISQLDSAIHDILQASRSGVLSGVAKMDADLRDDHNASHTFSLLFKEGQLAMAQFGQLQGLQAMVSLSNAGALLKTSWFAIDAQKVSSTVDMVLHEFLKAHLINAPASNPTNNFAHTQSRPAQSVSPPPSAPPTAPTVDPAVRELALHTRAVFLEVFGKESESVLRGIIKKAGQPIRKEVLLDLALQEITDLMGEDIAHDYFQKYL